jgi:hypothetical protein
MSAWLEVLLSFVGVMLVLALAAQSMQELVKVVFAIKGQTTRRALEGLLTEAATAENQPQSGPDLVERIVERLRGLGQNGVRPGAVRLDSLSADRLTDLILHVDPRRVAGTKTLPEDAARVTLRRIADHAEAWFPLAMEPVADRYRRRMRGLSFVSSAVIVLALNADALTILKLSRDDPSFRGRVGVTAGNLAALHGRVRELGTECLAERDSTTTTDSACARLKPALDSLDTGALRAAADTSFLLGALGDRRPREPLWWVGIVLSTLLVSLGAPFWHDLLEALFGLKNRVRAQAAKVSAETPPVAEVRHRIGPDDVAIVRGPAEDAVP